MEPKQIQVQIQAQLNQAFATDLEIYEQYAGKRVVIEEADISNNVSIGTLTRHGATTIELTDYMMSGGDLRNLKGIALHIKIRDIQNIPRAIVDYQLPRRVIAKSQVASIQLLEDVLQGVKEEEVFEK